MVLDALTANRKVWSKTVLFLMYDENDGWFDHVTPPKPPKGAHRERLTAKAIGGDTGGIREPLGLGVRVPMLVISPFSRGGHISSHTFDHTSQLRFLEERFDLKVEHISPWRRRTVGDLTSAVFRGKRDMSMPALPVVKLPAPAATGSCNEADEDTELTGGAGPTIPVHQRMPTQHGTTEPASKYFKKASGRPSGERVPATSRRRTATVKSSVNPLAHGGKPVTPNG
jgi:phospholipase C